LAQLTTGPSLVWQFFRDRLLHADNSDQTGYEAIPYQLHDINNTMGRDPGAALNELRSWYRADDNMFQFTGGRLLHSVFPACTKGLAAAAVTMAAKGDNDDVDFLLDVFRNYSGEATLYPIAKMLVQVLPEDDKRLESIKILLENTGGVWGEFGIADAMRDRKALMAEWLEETDVRIRAVATQCSRHLDNRIATEQRSAEMGKEQRKRDHE
jgi:hypothetical protein